MRKALIALFVIYLLLLVWTILWKVHVPFIGRDDMRELKLVPFASGDGFGANDPYEIAANFLLFVPLGVYLSALAIRFKPMWIVGASLLLEVAQFVLATGSSDVADLVVNTAGGAAGVGLYALLRPKTKPLVWVFGVGTVIAIAAIVFIIAAFPRMPHDGGVLIV